MREANTSLQEFVTMCKEFSQVLSTASIFKNTALGGRGPRKIKLLNPTSQIHLSKYKNRT